MWNDQNSYISAQKKRLYIFLATFAIILLFMFCLIYKGFSSFFSDMTNAFKFTEIVIQWPDGDSTATSLTKEECFLVWNFFGLNFFGLGFFILKKHCLDFLRQKMCFRLEMSLIRISEYENGICSENSFRIILNLIKTIVLKMKLIIKNIFFYLDWTSFASLIFAALFKPSASTRLSARIQKTQIIVNF